MNNQDVFHKSLELNFNGPTPSDELIFQAEKSLVEELTSEGYEMIVASEVSSFSIRWVFVKGEVSVEVINSPKDDGYQLSVVPKTAGPAVYGLILKKTPFISEGRRWLMVDNFWTTKEDVICFRANIQDVLHGLRCLGFKYQLHDRMTLPDLGLNLIYLSKEDSRFGLMVAFETRRIINGHPRIVGQEARVWIHTFFDDVLEIASSLFQIMKS